MPMLVMIRHGQSLWNFENRFTGSADVPLTAKGVADAEQAAARLSGCTFDVAYTSRLSRAEETLGVILQTLDVKIPVVRLTELNERFYGDLEGIPKEVVRQRYGQDIYQLWHRSYEIPPPGGESLAATVSRVGKAYRQTIAVDLTMGKNVLLVSHGNVIRSLIMQLDGLAPADISTIEVKTAVPLVYYFNDQLQVGDKRILAD
ncbi:MAG: 2,3-bisphosphoglycerate-dependent phosphoglycerate mutase [Deltaproteobacteria bacterium]|nr:2,3-bisphosphoglycerate-dependent phosphoglycerate mutase [Candidatus Anaeroferrophillus wilburensis]MBN2889801.1 2,3-bisphosphoglycerate-dependent phosphoglycerate mutase [Deltaproteobacteria bacterium]